LIRFLSDKLYTKEIDLRTGKALGAYLIKKAEDYIDACGGPIDVVSLKACGLEAFDVPCEWLSEAEINAMIKKMEDQESVLQNLIKPFS